jgi:hypothetical protein
MWLEKNGKRVMAEIKNIEQHIGTNRDAQGNWSNYIYSIVTAEWTDPQTHVKHTFHSTRIVNPGTYHVGGDVEVSIDPKDTSKYIMNIAG